MAVVAADERASGAAALEPSSGATSLQDFDVSRVLSLPTWVNRGASYAPGAKNLRVSGVSPHTFIPGQPLKTRGT